MLVNNANFEVVFSRDSFGLIPVYVSDRLFTCGKYGDYYPVLSTICYHTFALEGLFIIFWQNKINVVSILCVPNKSCG